MNVLYVIVRSLPSMNPGKAEAHSGHAACHFMYHNRTDEEVMDWAHEASGFGTQINLSDTYQSENGLQPGLRTLTVYDIHKLVNDLRGAGFIAGIVVDPEYPFRVSKEVSPFIGGPEVDMVGVKRVQEGPDYDTYVRPEITAFYVFGDKDSEKLQRMIGRFPLKR